MAGKGARSAPEIRPFFDRVTGARMWQVTDGPYISHPTYFLQSSFSPDGSSLLFTSYRAGSAQLFRAFWPGGELEQLTDGPAVHPFSPAFHPSGESVFFVRSGSVWRMDLRTLAETCLLELAGGQLGECSLSSDAQYLTAAAKRGAEAGLVTCNVDGGEEGWIPFPRTVIHPQFHPSGNSWILFAGDPAPRMFRVRRDGTGLECLHEHGNDEFIVHETFLGTSGNIVFTVWPRALCEFDWETRRVRTIADCNAWHIAPNRAGTKILCDTNHPDRGIFLIDAATGEQQHVCMSDATNGGTQWTRSRYALAEDFAAARSAAKSGALSWMETAADTVYGPQWTHPHPSFSNDERLIAFASDRTGHTQVYVASLDHLD